MGGRMTERSEYLWPNEQIAWPVDSPEVAVKEALALAARGLNGVPALVKWARRSDDNQRVFWSILYPKLLPVEVAAEVDMGRRFAAVTAQWLSE